MDLPGREMTGGLPSADGHVWKPGTGQSMGGVPVAEDCCEDRWAWVGRHGSAGMGRKDREGAGMLKKTAVEPQNYRDAMSLFAGAVQIVSTDGRSGRRGATVIAACSVSDDPPTILVALNRKCAANDLFRTNGVFALNTLGASHAELAHAFSGAAGLSQDQRFQLGDWTTLATGAPVFTGAAAAFDCEVTEYRNVATHRILFGRVVGLQTTDAAAALIYHKRGYRVL